MLLIPGMMCDARLFLPQIAALSAGRPVMVADISGADSIPALAAAVLEQAPPRFALAGLSMGGIVAMEMLHQAADRITRLALLNTNARAELPEVKASRAPQIEAARRGNLLRLMEEAMFPRYSVGPDPAITAIAAAMAADLGPEVFIRQSLALRDRADRADTLRGFTGPALILGSRHDELCPPERHHHMAGLMPRARLVMLDDAAHLTTLERPEETVACLKHWLENT
ncbi:alpha/beta fold hydrolase [Paracoccus aminovorans]|uniref:alpha/beta fold hydrolase n=1 Tax=Paracoccus aminovorans TaxID=34004 RepID=UPI002B25E8D5|nr:alpha/beta hydrolase [Paracoccus aminovorans]